MMYTVAVALLLATGNAYTFSNTRAVPRFARTALTMAATDVSTQAVLATVSKDYHRILKKISQMYPT